MKTPINVTQLCMDEPERQRLWEEDRRYPSEYFRNRFQWFHYPRWRYVAPFPLHVDFEVSSLCNLNCSMCFRRHFSNEQEFMHMDFDLFCRGVDECAANGLYSIRLSWRGECTLNPHLISMIVYAKKAGIREVSFLTNGSALSTSFCRELIRSGLDYVTVSVDGLEEDYNRIRTPLKYHNTLENIKKLYELKEKEGEGFPKVKVQGIYKYFRNEPELYYNTFKPFSDLISFNLEHDYSAFGGTCDENTCCPYLWQRLTVTATGMVPLCIADWDLDITLGDLGTSELYEIWTGGNMDSFRDLHMKGKGNQLLPCRKCIRLKEAVV